MQLLSDCSSHHGNGNGNGNGNRVSSLLLVLFVLLELRSLMRLREADARRQFLFGQSDAFVNAWSG